MKNLFFRVDDLGWENDKFQRLLEIFERHEMILNAAAIPSLFENAVPAHEVRDSKFLQVLVHGWAHKAHQTEPKKNEYPESRSSDEITAELLKARRVLADRFGQQFAPGFVPPWNRMNKNIPELLVKTGYKILSRDLNQSTGRSDLLEVNVTLDLHTDKKQQWKNPQGIVTAILSSHQGIMLHHTHMASEDFEILDLALSDLKKKPVRAVGVQEILQRGGL